VDHWCFVVGEQVAIDLSKKPQESLLELITPATKNYLGNFSQFFIFQT